MAEVSTGTVAIHSEEYQTHAESIAREHTWPEEPFGQYELSLYDRVKSKTTQRHFGVSEIELRERAENGLRALQQKFSTLSPNLEFGINSRLLSSYSDRFTSDDKSPLKQLAELPPDEFAEFLRAHESTMEQKRAEFIPSIEPLINAYFERFGRLVEVGQLPPVLDQVRSKIQKTACVTMDLFSGVDGKTGTSAASYGSETQNVNIRLGGDKEFTKRSLTHEVTHAGSGRTAIGIYEKEGKMKRVFKSLGRTRGMPPERKLKSIEHTRIGLDQSGVVNDTETERRLEIRRYTWLNEAVTEHVALLLESVPTEAMDAEQIVNLLRSNDKNQTYDEERLLLAMLLTSGKHEIPLMTVLEAYFEDYDPTKPPGTRAEKQRAMHEAFNSAYGPNFLPRLDSFIKGLREKGMPKNDAVKCATRVISLDYSLIDESFPTETKEDQPVDQNIWQKATDLARFEWDDREPPGKVRASEFVFPGRTPRVMIVTEDPARFINIKISSNNRQFINYVAEPGTSNWKRYEAFFDPNNIHLEDPPIKLDEEYLPMLENIKKHLAAPRSQGDNFTEGEVEMLQELLNKLNTDHERPSDEDIIRL